MKLKLSDDQKSFVKWVGILAPIYIIFFQMFHWMRHRSFAWKDLLTQAIMALALVMLGVLFFALADRLTGNKKQ
jgi:hypothetical protein